MSGLVDRAAAADPPRPLRWRGDGVTGAPDTLRARVAVDLRRFPDDRVAAEAAMVDVEGRQRLADRPGRPARGEGGHQ